MCLEQLVDSMAAMLVRDAARYDVIVTTNMFGDILSDEAAELSGSLGLAGSINASDNHCMAQAQHGSAPDIAGLDKAIPVSLDPVVAMLLDWLARTHGRDALAQAARVDRLAPSMRSSAVRRCGDGGLDGRSRTGASVAFAELLPAGRQHDRQRARLPSKSVTVKYVPPVRKFRR